MNVLGLLYIVVFKVLECKLFRYMGLLLDFGFFSDVILCIRGREFKVYKVILVVRFFVFGVMFEYEMEESRKGRVEISDIDLDVFYEMLKFVYIGSIL